jgi:hypothetical protein
MTVRGFTGVILRRWYVLLLVGVLAAVGGFALHRTAGVYATRTIVSFMFPNKTSLSPNSGIDDASVIAFAGVVAKEVNDGQPPPSYSTDDAPFYGAGVRQGVLVTLLNAGNQWANSYQRAQIELQIVGPTKEWVAQTQSDLLTKITQAAEAEQISMTTKTGLITTSVVPMTLQIFHVMPSRSGEVGALAALGAAALIVGIWAAVSTDRVLRPTVRRRARRDPALQGGLES